MVSEGNRTGLYVIIPIYFVVLVGVSAWAYFRTRRLKSEQKTDNLTVHYLGGRSLGPLLTAGSLFASVFSGYTISGIPNEAYATGWTALRWIPLGMYSGVGFLGAGVRLRRAGLLRNHATPVDFLTDRYRSQVLRYTTVVLQVLPTLVYLAAQVIAIQRTFNGMFDLDPGNPAPTVIIMLFIVGFESLGGLSTVAMTDTIQAIVLGFGFVFVPIAITRHYGGWASLDPETYPKPQFYQTPSANAQWSFWQFSLINVAFFTMPHIMQRFYAARDLKSIKIGLVTIVAAGYINFLAAVFIGTMAVQLLSTDGVASATADAFSDILELLIELGGFNEFVACLAFAASLAAIMSTADSLIIALSQLVTVELVRPALGWLQKYDADHKSKLDAHLVWYGRGISVLSVGITLIMGLLYSGNLTDLTRIQFSLSAQCFPAFFVGLFATTQRTDAHPWSLSLGALVGALAVFLIHFVYLKGNAEALALNSGIIGVLLNGVTILLAEAFRRLAMGQSQKAANDNNEDEDDEAATTELLYPHRPSWDIPSVGDKYGTTTLTPQILWESMAGVPESITNGWWVSLTVVACTYVTPLVAGGMPGLTEDGVFAPEHLPLVVDGLPWWALKILLTSVVLVAVILPAVLRLPDVFPGNAQGEAEETSAFLKAPPQPAQQQPPQQAESNPAAEPSGESDEPSLNEEASA